MKLLLISTCGTSLLTNRVSAELRDWFTDIANRRDLSAADTDRLGARLRDCAGVFMEADATARRRLSAEMAGIDAVLEQLKPERVQHVLIHTDTAIGEAASGIVAEGLRGRGDSVILLTAGGLRTDDLASFREALADLTGSIEQFAAWRDEGWTIYFNLTGGFKSINGYLQALGMIHADRCVFLFERSATLMEIPRLPVRLSEIEDVSAHLTVFRRLACGYPVRRSEALGIPEALLLADGERVATSVWGDVVWARRAKALLAARLLEPLSPRLAFSRTAQTAFDKQTAEVRIAFNAALDALSAHLDGWQPVLKSHTFKKLQGDPTPPSTHELYVRLEAKRIYGHYEDNRFVVDRFGPHL
jgi:CRISPR/Cas system-associated protein Csm6